MLSQRVYGDPAVYARYYVVQAGHGLEGFRGDEYMYGAGLAGLFRGLFRRAVPLFRKGIELVKPHVKNAARNIAKDALASVSTAVMDRLSRAPQEQEGSGLVYVAKKTRKRKRRLKTTFPPLLMDKRAVRKRRRGQKSVRRSADDIF